MRTIRRFAPFVLLVWTSIAAGQTYRPHRTPLPVPNLPGYETLKADFHIHTVFSDGLVWPTVRVWEAWRDGLDALAITDHVEYHPHEKDMKVDGTRSVAVAQPAADELGIILIPGVEITKNYPGHTAHFNALFVKDPNGLMTDDLHEALRRAHAQGAFIFWNHPAYRAPKAEWFPPIAAAHEAGLFRGMELINEIFFYSEAYPWIEEKKLTILATSDVHDPMPTQADTGRVRPITLVFAKSRDAEGIREALFSRRTAAWMGGEVWGAEEHLRGLWNGAITVENPELRRHPGSGLFLRIRNTSAMPFQFVVKKAPEWLKMLPARIAPESVTALRLDVAKMPGESMRFELEVELANCHIGPGRNLVVKVPLSLNLGR